MTAMQGTSLFDQIRNSPVKISYLFMTLLLTAVWALHLATPLLAGPGTIATAMNLSSQADPLRLGLTLAAFALLCAITYAAFMNGHALLRWVGQSGMNALTRIMGLILAVIGAQMMIEGIKGAFNLG